MPWPSARDGERRPGRRVAASRPVELADGASPDTAQGRRVPAETPHDRVALPPRRRTRRRGGRPGGGGRTGRTPRPPWPCWPSRATRGRSVTDRAPPHRVAGRRAPAAGPHEPPPGDGRSGWPERYAASRRADAGSSARVSSYRSSSAPPELRVPLFAERGGIAALDLGEPAVGRGERLGAVPGQADDLGAPVLRVGHPLDVAVALEVGHRLAHGLLGQTGPLREIGETAALLVHVGEHAAVAGTEIGEALPAQAGLELAGHGLPHLAQEAGEWRLSLCAIHHRLIR